MKRWAGLILIFLLLGAAVNVAVGWGASLWSPLSYVGWPHAGAPTQVDRQRWRALAGEDADLELLYVEETSARWGVRLTLMSAGDSKIRVENPMPGVLRYDWDDDAVLHQILLLESGWPARCLSGYRRDSGPITWGIGETLRSSNLSLVVSSASPGVNAVAVDSLGLGPEAHRFLPVGIMWWGFLCNTLLFAIAFALLWIAFFIARRSYRTWRGFCPSCGYDLRGGGHTTCPECGAAVTPEAQEAKHPAEIDGSRLRDRLWRPSRRTVVITLSLIAVIAGWVTYSKVRTHIRTEARREFLIAIIDNDLKTIERMLERDPTIVGPRFSLNGHSLLGHACSEWNADLVELLLGKGFDATERSLPERTPMHALVFASERMPKPLGSRGDAQRILDMLLGNGADVNAVDARGLTPLHYAAMRHVPGLVEHLLLQSAEVNPVGDEHGLTPLHLACWAADVQSVRVLLEWGADPTATDLNGRTPRDILLDPPDFHYHWKTDHASGSGVMWPRDARLTHFPQVIGGGRTREDIQSDVDEILLLMDSSE